MFDCILPVHVAPIVQARVAAKVAQFIHRLHPLANSRADWLPYRLGLSFKSRLRGLGGGRPARFFFSPETVRDDGNRPE
jgi:hypothetical protein